MGFVGAAGSNDLIKSAVPCQADANKFEREEN
jgi:hypothetical protein